MCLASQWGNGLNAQNSCAAGYGVVRAGCCGERQPLYSSFIFINIMEFIHKVEMKHPFTMAISLPRHRTLTMSKEFPCPLGFFSFLTVVMNFHHTNCRLTSFSVNPLWSINTF